MNKEIEKMNKAIKKEQLRREKIRPKAEADAEQYKKLNDLENIGRKMAETEIKYFGYYTCKIDGIKTFVTA